MSKKSKMEITSAEHSTLVYFYHAMEVCKNNPTKRQDLINLVLLDQSYRADRSKSFILAVHRFDNLKTPEEVVAVAKQLKLDIL